MTSNVHGILVRVIQFFIQLLRSHHTSNMIIIFVIAPCFSLMDRRKQILPVIEASPRIVASPPLSRIWSNFGAFDHIRVNYLHWYDESFVPADDLTLALQRFAHVASACLDKKENVPAYRICNPQNQCFTSS